MKISIVENDDLQFEFDIYGIGVPITSRISDIFTAVKATPEDYSGCFVQGIREWLNDDEMTLYYVNSETNDYLVHFVWEKADGTLWQLLPKENKRIKFLETFAHKDFEILPYETKETEKLMILLDRRK